MKKIAYLGLRTLNISNHANFMSNMMKPPMIGMVSKPPIGIVIWGMVYEIRLPSFTHINGNVIGMNIVHSDVQHGNRSPLPWGGIPSPNGLNTLNGPKDLSIPRESQWFMGRRDASLFDGIILTEVLSYFSDLTSTIYDHIVGICIYIYVHM